MLRFFITFLIITSSVLLNAQSLEEIRTAAGKNQWERARSGIDSFLLKESNAKSAEGWYLKSLILYKIVTGVDGDNLAPKGHKEAFEAYKRYFTLANEQKLPLQGGHEIIFGISFNSIEKANNDFQHKRYREALERFIEVDEMEQFISQKKLSYQDFSFPVFDTQLYVNIAAAAINAGREDIAVNYYRKIADNRIIATGFDGIYRYLADRFTKNGDRSIRDKYLKIGMELYPDDPFWCQLLLRDPVKEKTTILTRYEELINGPCRNYNTYYNYAVEMYNYNFKQKKRPSDFSKSHPRIPGLLEKANELKRTVEANLLAGRYYLSLINDLIDQYNLMADNPRNIKAREALSAQINQHFDKVKFHAEEALQILGQRSTLTSVEKEQYSTANRMMADYWTRKGDRAKAKEYMEESQ